MGLNFLFSFLKLYNRDDVECIGVDAAAAQLGPPFLLLLFSNI